MSARRVLAFAVLLPMLLIPWAWLGRLYAGWVGGLAAATLSRAAAPVTFTFEPPLQAEGAPAQDTWQLGVRAEDPRTGRLVETALDLRRTGYLASAVFAALALVTRLERRRRLGLLASGLAALQAIPLIALLAFFSGRLPVQAFHPPALLRWLLEIAYRSLVAAPGMTYAAPLMLWVLLWFLLRGAEGAAQVGGSTRRRSQRAPGVLVA